MLRNREEKNERVKDEAYYVERSKYVIDKTKGLSLVAKVGVEGGGTYKIQTSGFDDEEKRNHTYGGMYARCKEGSSEEENIVGKCFVST